MTEASALVLFSGGQDSTTALAWALHRHQHVETVGFAYGQRHAVELACRQPLRTALSRVHGSRLGPDHMVDLSHSMTAIGATALTADSEITVTCISQTLWQYRAPAGWFDVVNVVAGRDAANWR